jgi:site-specific DNA-cytosine methylase
MVSIAAWASLVLVMAFPIVVLEESDKMDPDLVHDLFGCDYRIEHCILDSTQFGFPIRRNRFYGVLLHRMLVLECSASFGAIVRSFHRPTSADFAVFFTAAQEEFDHELEWAISRPNSQALGKSLRDVRESGNPFLRALTSKETTVLHDYMSDRPACVGMLNQNPDANWRIRTSGSELYTLIHNPAIHWIGKVGRWMTASEHLLSQGFPTAPELVNPLGQPRPAASCYSTVQRIIAERRQQVLGEAGNSQNTACVYASLLFALVFVKVVDV